MLALALGETLGAALATLVRRYAMHAAHRRQRAELASLPGAVARDLGIDAALLRQAPGLASSRNWLQRS